MHNRCQSDVFDILPGHSLAQFGIQQHTFGNISDSLNMIAGFRIPELDCRCHGFDHALIQFFNPESAFQKFFLLPAHLTSQPFSGFKKLDHRLYPAMNDIRYHRFSDDVHGSELIGLPDTFGRILSRN